MQHQEAILAAIATTGFAMLPPLDRIEEMNDFLRLQPVFVDAHVPQTSRNASPGMEILVHRDSPAANASECVCVHTDAAIVAPGWIERALELTDVAAKFLGRDPPVGYSMNFFFTRPGPAALRGDIQAFHRDADDTKFIGMFVYLSDVFTEEHGPHDLEGPDGVVRTIYGPAGTMFLADTSHPHRGRKPMTGERGFGWFRWGVSDRPPANAWDKIEPIPSSALGSRYPDDPRLRESIKLLVSPP